jgi:hypothetical protein
VALFSARRPDGRDLVQKIFVKIPMTRMAQLSRDAGTRLVYVFVPPRSPHAGYAATVEDLRRLLLAHGAEVVDVQAALAPTDGEFGPAPRKRLPLDWVWPPELGQILTLWNIRSAHRRDKFLDAVHPTEIGNAIVAAEVGRHLATPVGAPDASRRSWREADSSCGPADTRSARVWR